MKRRIRIRRRDGIKQRYWVGKRLKNYGSGGVKLYHVTKKENVPSILKKGLFPQKPKSVFGERSKEDPSAVYTFVDSPFITKTNLIEAFQGQVMAESSKIKKYPKDYYNQPPEEQAKKEILEINLPLEEFERRRLPPSFGAKEHEFPIKGRILPKNIRVLGHDFYKKASKEKARLQDYYTAFRMTPEEITEYFGSRGHSQLKNLFK